MRRLVLASLAVASLACARRNGEEGVSTTPPRTVDQPLIALRGTVTYRERMALPAGAQVHVALLDVSRQDAPADTVAATMVTPAGQVPVAFVLGYPVGRIDQARMYALSARIDVDGRTWFASGGTTAVLTRGAPVNDVELVVARRAQ